MKDILNIMRFDFLTAYPLAHKIFAAVAALFILLGLFLAPLACAYITLGSMIFVIPLQSVAEKSDFRKLYGTLPVRRRNITRARFLYIFLVHFAAEVLELILAFISMPLKLYRVLGALPNLNGEMMQMIEKSFVDTKLTLVIIIGVFAVFCLIFSYMKMMGQICGRENEFKIIIITIGIIAIPAIGIAILINKGAIPVIKLPSLPDTAQGMLIVGAVLNVIMLGLCLLFGEITAGKLAGREL